MNTDAVIAIFCSFTFILATFHRLLLNLVTFMADESLTGFFYPITLCIIKHRFSQSECLNIFIRTVTLYARRSILQIKTPKTVLLLVSVLTIES